MHVVRTNDTLDMSAQKSDNSNTTESTARTSRIIILHFPPGTVSELAAYRWVTHDPSQPSTSRDPSAAEAVSATIHHRRSSESTHRSADAQRAPVRPSVERVAQAGDVLGGQLHGIGAGRRHQPELAAVRRRHQHVHRLAVQRLGLLRLASQGRGCVNTGRLGEGEVKCQAETGEGPGQIQR